jgi:hypothetical protein
LLLCIRNSGSLVPWVAGATVACLLLIIPGVYVLEILVLPFALSAYAVFLSHLFALNSGADPALAAVKARFGTIAVIALLVLGVTALALFPLGWASFAVLQSSGPPGVAAIDLPVTVVALYLTGRIVILPTVIALEDALDLKSVSRAWALTSSRRWESLVISIIAMLPLAIGFTAFVVLGFAVFALILSAGEVDSGLRIAIAASASVSAAAFLYVPYALAIQALFYLRLTSTEDASA